MHQNAKTTQMLLYFTIGIYVTVVYPMEEGSEQRAMGEETIARARLEKDPARKLFYATKAIELLPDDARAWIERGKALMQSGMFSEAEEQIHEIIRHNPDDGEGWYLHGLLMKMTARKNQARDSLQKAASTLKNPSSAQYALGRLLADDGEYEEALALFDAALREESKNADIWYARGRVLCALSRYNHAIISFDHVLEYRVGDHLAQEARRRAIKRMNQELHDTTGRNFALLREEADYEGLVRMVIRDTQSKALKAAQELVRLGTGATIYIRPLLSHDDPVIRYRALHILLAIGDPRCARLFVRLALSIPAPEEGGGEKSAALISAIGNTLEGIGGTALSRAFEEALTIGNERAIIRAIRLVERTQDCRSIPELLSATRNASVRVVFAALSALGTVGDQQAIDRVYDLQNNQDPVIRRHAREALRQIVHRNLHSLMKQYASGNDGERAFIADLLNHIGGELAQPLLKILSNEDDLTVQAAVSEALVLTADAKAIPALINSLATPDERIVKTVSEALIAVGVPAVHPLMKYIRDPRRRVCERAGEVLAGMKRTALPALIGALESEDMELHEAAREIILKIGPDALPSLTDAASIKKDPECKEMLRSMISLIKKKERMTRLLAEYRGEEPIR